MARYVMADGAIWKLSERAYKKMRKDIKEKGGWINPDNYGTIVVTSFEHMSDIVSELEFDESEED
jgi:hypothetical protein